MARLSGSPRYSNLWYKILKVTPSPGVFLRSKHTVFNFLPKRSHKDGLKSKLSGAAHANALAYMTNETGGSGREGGRGFS